MSFVAILWLALDIGGPRAVGLVVFMAGVVAPLLAPVIGHLLDRYGLRRLMLLDNLGRGVLALGLAALTLLGQVSLEYLLLFTVLSACLSPATEVGQNVAVPLLVESADLDVANQLMSSSWDVAAWLGPAFAGVAMGWKGPGPVLLVDSATFLVMSAVSLRMPGRSAHVMTEDVSATGSTLSRMFLGFRVLWQLKPVAVLAIVGVADLFLGGMMEVVLPAFNKLTLGQGPTEYGLLVSIAGVACLAGTLLLTPRVSRLGYGPALLVVLAARGLAVIPLAFAGSWATAAIVVAVASVPDGSFFPISRTIQQRLIPAHLRGRVQGAKGALGAAGFPLGAAIAGLLIAGIGASWTVVIMGIGYLPLAAVITFTPQLMAYAPGMDGGQASIS